MAPRITVPGIKAHKRSKGDPPIVMLTAYDAPGARIAVAGGVDIILVGDSVAMTVLGHNDTLHVTVEQMAVHVAAVNSIKPDALVVCDMPWLSYHLGDADAIRNASQLIRAGAVAVKLEGGRIRLPVIEALISSEIPVMGHIGLTPQSIHRFGGYRVQGKDPDAAEMLVQDAVSLAEAGCFAIVLEAMPKAVAAEVTASIPVPTIGIGAGSGCDGQVLVFHDLLGLSERVPKFVRRYATLADDAVKAVSEWSSDVRAGMYPSDEESYH
ncbi:MAG: 3-methyl-2-oxobutanoate hydroxymethyltransferase [Acidimicrobiales bacterium]